MVKHAAHRKGAHARQVALFALDEGLVTGASNCPIEREKREGERESERESLFRGRGGGRESTGNRALINIKQ